VLFAGYNELCLISKQQLSISLSMNSSHLVKYLAWDSQFFGFNIGMFKPSSLDADQWAAIEQESRDLNLTCLYLLADPANPAAIQMAEQAGFHFMDARLTLEFCRPANFDANNLMELPNHRIRNAQMQDLPELKAIARDSHHNTRFYADPNFSLEDCNRLYEVWIENSLKGYAQQVFIVENRISKTVEGYITCHLKDGKGEIGLTAVHLPARGQQIGYSLVQKSLSWFYENAAETIEVVTQGGSRSAVNLYQKAGFLTSDLKLWFHKWFHLPESGKFNSAE
jgi:dTDP-4-amino-4,6-dideoxy-D-galactose acyltransferase